MLAETIVDRVCQLLAAGQMSQRKIARAMGISRGTVGSLAKGHRPHPRRTAWMDDDLFRPQGPPTRCRSCGGMVFLPCLLCRMRKSRDTDRAVAAIDRTAMLRRAAG